MQRQTRQRAAIQAVFAAENRPLSPREAQQLAAGNEPGLGIGVSRRQDDIGAQGWIAARLPQHAQTDFVTVFLKVFHLLEHGASRDVHHAAGDDSSRFATGMQINSSDHIG